MVGYDKALVNGDLRQLAGERRGVSPDKKGEVLELVGSSELTSSFRANAMAKRPVTSVQYPRDSATTTMAATGKSHAGPERGVVNFSVTARVRSTTGTVCLRR